MVPAGMTIITTTGIVTTVHTMGMAIIVRDIIAIHIMVPGMVLGGHQVQDGATIEITADIRKAARQLDGHQPVGLLREKL